ncbi:hypothetical protein G7B40_003400 [Aetokthonos hydrillicola Thurmond2011]|jgi:hypothetical protein|uniref:VWA containing CoxE family protein n=1 Tax=Aetokthonos hydrillicola Thurmond2011 TaxID=2712845 RepID=A0AAP5M8U3_9CYAN|nr:hypothetical protein [Aetokthonos hydrillicola]MBO3462315.1 hypothetical protein [Aetokthonos hydrillicola CCALA 1050]MBW4590826.1 hypothetical protein [Aetokthonos hydrillicola CCALA 1050]MDR9893629.1 hypothetical protein [Aetokthonos hydrillicola Thurmond2011]
MKATQEELPLLNLFTQLREAGLPLGIDEYRLVLKALQEGFGIADQESLAELCRTLWIKSKDEEHLFNYHFDQVIKLTHPIITPTTSEQREPNLEQRKPSLEQQKFSSPPKAPYGGNSDQQPTPPETTPASVPVSSELMQVEDEVRVATAVQIATRSDEDIYEHRFTESDEYFPVTRRQMKQSWRHLRRLVREGLPIELDVEATIDRVGQQGVLLEPVLIPRRVNRTELLLLIDQKGSMVPFHMLGNRLAETAQRGGRLGKAGVYYFHNCPTRYLYHEPTRQKAKLIQDVLDQLRPERSAVLIFSDAGAARGGFSSERLELTKKFLDQLKQRVRYIAWLNPMVKERWFETTAGEIARWVPMFEISRQGMDRAIDVLRGREG